MASAIPSSDVRPFFKYDKMNITVLKIYNEILGDDEGNLILYFILQLNSAEPSLEL